MASHNNVLVERADIQDMEFHVDLEAVVADFVSTSSDIKDVLASVDSDDVAAFVAAWLNDEYNSGEFVPAIRHIMYANTMLDLASLLIAAAEQELEEGTDVDPLCVEKMVAEELAKRGHTEEMQKVLSEDYELAEALKQQLFGDHSRALRKISQSLEPAVEAQRSILDDTSKPMLERIDAAARIKDLSELIKAINPTPKDQPSEEAA
ncbi:hypothetical protein J8Z28_20380 [Pseudoalteromonas sp. SCSIO 43088]|uniref:hypothetical protein n=1 Tax=Pseudoalteromonas sp. SCSIO 43088 TaxID=2822846 RepID=UPI00202AFEE9|nr:hypothetical protein [Pseudoalteromonas sp. SCSIO 43088]URQ88245.1 hypothetical protein J8Z28_20380 [Pseudoalteromonas sp. SCSIO 43088]